MYAQGTNMQPRVSLITVNFNGTDVTRALLQSLQKVTYNNLEIIVVDNGSKVPCSVLKDEFPEIVYLDTKANLGFAGGNNRGLELATGEYLILLNNDIEVDSGFLEPLVEAMRQHEKVGVVCPKILYFDAPDILQYVGFSPIHPITGRGFSIGYQEKDNGQYDLPGPTARAHGAAMMFSREVMDKVGMMAELYFLYYEEMDYCERIKRAGYSIWFEPRSKVWHKESMATGKGSTLKTYYYARNRMLYIRRNVFGITGWIALFYYFVVAVPRNLLQHLVRREWAHMGAFLKGIAWNFTHGKHDVHDK